MLVNLDQAWATTGPRATYDPPSTLMWPATVFQGDKLLRTPLKRLFLRKETAKSPISLKNHIDHIFPHSTYTVTHRSIFFPMWPVSQKELPTSELDLTTSSLVWSLF